MANVASMRVAAYRQRMSDRRWRQVRLWAPDMRAKEMRASLAAQGQAIAANTEDERDTLDWIESLNGLPEWQ